ncbi:MAG: GNAT family N-acetyltransferase [Thermoplasmatales archaeon]|nr:GNAT family N-acetyltransferase [Thermoplasmatales archaeon]
MGFDFPGYTLRPAAPEDRQYFVECMAEGLLASVDDLEFEHAGTWMPASASFMEGYLEGGFMGNELFILEGGGERAGMLWLEKTSEQFTCEDTGYVLGIHVGRGHRGKGLARAMISYAEEWAKERGCMHLNINCGTANAPAMSLYESAGYGKRSVTFRKDLYP